MRAAWNLRGVLIISLLGALLGCKDETAPTANGSNGQVQQFAPSTAAALTDPNAIYTVTIGGAGTTTLRFPASGQYQEIVNGETVNGTISNLQNNGNTWTATLTPDPNQQGAQSGALTLTWTAQNTGTFTFLPIGAPAQSGTFTVTQPGSTAGGGGTTNSNGGTTVTSLVGRTLQLNYPTGGGEKFVFTSATVASYENGVDSAMYQYDNSTGQLNLKRSGGQTYHLILSPGPTSGSTTVIYQEAGGNPTSFLANYTLQ